MASRINGHQSMWLERYLIFNAKTQSRRGQRNRFSASLRLRVNNPTDEQARKEGNFLCYFKVQ
jgi:hypothetical protein